MDRNTILKSIFCVVALTLVSCTQDYEMAADDAAGDANGEALPEGMYPLQIGSISVSAEGSGQPWGAEEPQTRVSENSDGSGSLFKANDAIGVSLGGNTATYTYKGSTWTSTKPLYWKDTNQATVAAWFPAAYTYVTLADQKTEGLAYVLKATATADFNTEVSLTFTHQLAKVRVELSGLRASKVTGMEIYSYTSCTHTQGTVSTSGARLGWIKMKSVTYNGTEYWEANVVPGQTITEFRINESTEGTLNNGNGITPEAGKMHKISLQVNANGVSTTATPITTSNCTISGYGDYVVSGEFNSTITVTGGDPKIYLVDATVSVKSGNAISITGNASPTIHVVGENTVKNTSETYSGAGIYVGSGSSVTITGNGRDDVLTATAGGDAAGIGSTGNTTNATCGNITIKNVTVKAYGSTSSDQSPGIGAYSNCGTINIENAKVYAYGTAQGGSSAPAIGSYKSVPDITISDSDIYAYRGSYAGTSYADYIGRGGAVNDYEGGAIRCGNGSITNTTVYKGAYTSSTSSSDENSVVYNADGTAQ